MTGYREFLASKRIAAQPSGIDYSAPLNPALKDWQEAIVRWALRRGRAALFEGCGLGKTVQQLEYGRVVAAHVDAPVMILTPLAVAMQTVAEGEKFGIPVTLCREQADVRAGVNVCNYDRLHLLDPRAFGGVVLDESSILKAMDGKTRTALIEAFAATPYRLCCTATPAPNDHMELGNHAEFLGIMRAVEMLAMFFNHDGGETSKWRLKGHAVKPFWRWVASWSVNIRTPSDIGYSDDGYVLPPLIPRTHKVASPTPDGALFSVPAGDLSERRKARRDSLEDRCQWAADQVAAHPGEPIVLWVNLNDEAGCLARMIPEAVEVRGTDTNDEKEDGLNGFREGRYRVLISKARIAGLGLNWQHCARMIYVGVSDSWEELYQSTRRCWRFGQQRPVHVDIVISEAESSVLENLERKQAAADLMAAEVAEAMREFETENVREAQRSNSTLARKVEAGDGWTSHLGDSVDVFAELPADSVGYSVFSPPFASLYTYTDTEEDMGNCTTYDTFMEHFSYLVRELYRVTMPGRNLSFHCMNLPTSKVRDGVIGLRDFRGMLIRLFEEHGWIYHSEVCIWKDPVTAMQRTKALGLLWKQLKKDSTMSRQGVPDYLVTMRKPGENASPVSHRPESFPVARWQQWASPVWMDINPSDTLQTPTKEDRDEKHICPLQLGVIERGIALWSNPGDLVADPFSGIASTGYQALLMGRRALLSELKEAWWEDGVKNLRAAEIQLGQGSLFAAASR